MVAAFTSEDSLAFPGRARRRPDHLARDHARPPATCCAVPCSARLDDGSDSDPSGNYNPLASAASDGSQTPKVILAEDCDASGGAKETVAYFAGTFNEEQLHFGTGHDKYSVREALRDVGINLQNAIT
jgi:hypothetical protein